MRIEQLYSSELSESAYYVESDGEVAIIDPLRDPQPYISMARKNNASIRYILETHFHADFVSCHQELANRTGAQIIYGPTATPMYKAHVARDGELLRLGRVSFKVLHTPGHSLESTTYLLRQENGEDHAIFTGDTLFIDEVGRPDLVQLVKSEMTPEFLAGLMYDALRNKILPLPDHVIVYPGHGAGSFCGRNLSALHSDTLGNQRRSNYALDPDLSREDFIARVTENQDAPPPHFPFNILMNVSGDIPVLSQVISRGTVGLTPLEFRKAREEEEAVVLDCRPAEAFREQYIPGSYNVDHSHDLSSWIGVVVKDIRQPILLITGKGEETEAVIRLSGIGYHNIIGYLKGGIKAWAKEGFEVQNH